MVDDLKFNENVGKLVEEFESDFKEIIDNFPGNLLLDNKLFHIYNLLNIHYERSCRDLINNVKNIQKSKKDEQLHKAVLELEKCREPFKENIQDHIKIRENFMKFFKNQTMFCYKECYEKFGDKDEIKPCMRECINNFDKFTLTSFGELYSDYLDNINENLMKNL